LPANALLLQSWSPVDAVARSFSSVSWSLSCEFFFYATFPLLVRWLWRVRRPIATAVVLVVLAFGVGVALQLRSPGWGLWLFHLPAFRIVEFACGALAATAVMRGWRPRLRMRWAAVSVVVSYLTVLLLPLAIGYRMEDRWALTLVMVPSFVALIATCAHVDIVGAPSPLQGRTMVSLGQWSFCIYMAHPVVITLTMPLLGSPSLPGSALGCVLVVLAVVGVSFVLYVTFERPLERWLRGPADVRASGEGSTAPSSVMPAPALPVPKTLATD
jgi:peptidoglycan/LPS O-acetylase OafA/YrhL